MPITPGFEKRSRERRQIDLGAPPPGTKGHLVDLVFFRSLGVGILVHETVLTPQSEWSVIMAGVMMFFMPEAVRGRNSLGASVLRKALTKWLDREP